MIASGSLGAGPSVSVTIPGALIAAPGTYLLTMQGVCGQSVCQCRLFLVVEECPPGNTNELCGKAVVTCFPGFVNNTPSMGINTAMPAFGIVDVRDRSATSPGTYWAAASGANIYHPAHWNYTNTGLVFGIAIDNQQNFYLSSTTLYGCPSPTFNPFGPGGAAGNAVRRGASIYHHGHI